MGCAEGLFDEAWRERHRATLNPLLDAERTKTREAEALGTRLSGSGSTILAIAEQGHADGIAWRLKTMGERARVAIVRDDGVDITSV